MKISERKLIEKTVKLIQHYSEIAVCGFPITVKVF